MMRSKTSASWLLPPRPVTKPLQTPLEVCIEHAESSQATHRLFLAAYILESMFTQRRQRNSEFASSAACVVLQLTHRLDSAGEQG